MRGSRRSLAKFFCETVVALLTGLAAASGAPLVDYRVEGDRIAMSLTGRDGDPARGRDIVANRQVSACLLCHSGSFAEPQLQGTIAPPLDGVGSRLTIGEIRLRLVDPSKVTPNTMMPAYYRIEGLNRVGQPWQGRPVLSAEQIEDVVAYLATLRSP